MIKVCGMRDEQNVKELAALNPHAIGFIFHQASPRYAGEVLSNKTKAAMEKIPLKTGVFVHTKRDKIIALLHKNELNTAQLHGAYNADDCAHIRSKGYFVVKNIPLDESFDPQICDQFLPYVDYFLFDTKTASHGGSGMTYDRKLLERYKAEKPFFISGGIDLNESIALKNFHHPSFTGIDINSRFEISPGIKNIKTLKSLFHHINCPLK